MEKIDNSCQVEVDERFLKIWLKDRYYSDHMLNLYIMKNISPNEKLKPLLTELSKNLKNKPYTYPLMVKLNRHDLIISIG